ncbi:MAG TPA: exodeoxyribonuclease VII small subunit [Edaphobacter sp.]|nr:exodeoxyribonuclease VII small subunit [Edaphobacter sp.]
MASFEQKLAALETVVEKLERGDLPLEESVRLFEEGVKLSDACKKELEEAEGRIQILVERGNKMRAVDLDVEESAGK